MIKQLVYFFIFLTASAAQATELAPWYSRYLELQPKATALYQAYRTIDTVDGFKKRGSNDLFLFLSLAGAYSIYSIEFESTFANTRHRNFGPADLRLTGRYQWLDDTIDDPVSLVTSLTAMQVFTLARNDISSWFYHGGIQFEFDVSVGKELVCEQFWVSRLWAVGGIGVADIGSPWLRCNIAWDHNWWDAHQVNIFVNTVRGLGGEGLHLHRHFHGYGPIHYQSVDAGIEYDYQFECGAVVGISYIRRLYALNCPRCVNMGSMSLLFPFGL